MLGDVVRIRARLPLLERAAMTAVYRAGYPRPRFPRVVCCRVLDAGTRIPYPICCRICGRSHAALQPFGEPHIEFHTRTTAMHREMVYICQCCATHRSDELTAAERVATITCPERRRIHILTEGSIYAGGHFSR
jgi:hypothetical protein